MKSRPSTDLDNTLAWSNVADAMAEQLAPVLGISKKEVTAWVRNPARTNERLERANGAELAILEILVDARGSLALPQLFRLAKQRHDFEIDKTESAMLGLEGALLAVRAHPQGSWGPQHDILALLDVAAPTIAERVRGISLPTTLPPNKDLGGESSSSLRETVAVLAAAAHVTLRTTQRFDVNRTTARKLATMLGMDEGHVTGILDAGLRSNVLAVSEGIAVPQPDALRALARGEKRLGGSPEDDLVMGWAPTDRWMPREALVRAVALARLEWAGPAAWSLAESAVARASLAKTTHQGHVFVRRAGMEHTPGKGDGHVTPSFEIMLGPRADLEILAVLALAATPTRIDRVITLKLEPASLTAAAVCGLGWDAIASALSAVGPHPVPENVALMAREWHEKARIVRLRHVWAAECSTKEAADAAAKALGDRVVARPTPTLLLVQWGPYEKDPAQTLSRSGVRVIPAVIEREGQRFAPPPPTPLPRAPAILEARGDATLAARVREARANGFPTAPIPPPSLALALEKIRARSDCRSKPAREALDLLVGVARVSEPELARWLSRLPFSERLRASELVRGTPYEFLDWLLLEPSARLAVCDAGSVDRFLGLASQGRPSVLSYRVKQLMAESAEVRELLGFDDQDDDDFYAELEAHEPDDDVEDLEGLAPQPPDEVQRRFTEAVQRNQVLTLRVSSKTSGERVIAIAPERIIARGNDVMLLGVDTETQQNRSYPLRTIVAACVRA